LESKLEVLRSRVEESSTSANSSAQAKLLRQIDMLQTQHTIASQNWQRIEGSLQNRTETLEQEKLDITQRWEDEKRKVKDAVLSVLTMLKVGRG
jgi:TATA element modulatory factor